MGRSLPDIGGQVSCSLFDGQHHYGDNYGDTDTGQNPQCTGSDKLVWVLSERDEPSACHINTANGMWATGGNHWVTQDVTPS